MPLISVAGAFSGRPLNARSASGLRILFVTAAHDSLSRRAFVALRALGHRAAVEVVDSPAAIETVVALHDPELVVCPVLDMTIPERVARRRRCLLLRPCPSSLAWAL